MQVIGFLSAKQVHEELISKFKEENAIIYFMQEQFMRNLKELEQGIVLLDGRFFWQLYQSAKLQRVINSENIMLVILSQRAQSHERILFLENGADNVWPYSFPVEELHSRISACVRFLNKIYARHTSVQRNKLFLDPKAKTVHIENCEVELTASEYLILSRMVHHPKRIYDREELMAIMNSSGEATTLRVIDTHIKNLRKKIEDDPSHPGYIKTVHGRGYRFDPDEMD